MGSGPRLVRNLTVRRIDDGALARRDARAPLRMILHVEDGLIEPAGRITLQVRLAVRATRHRPPLYQRSLIVRAEFLRRPERLLLPAPAALARLRETRPTTEPPPQRA